MEIAKKLKDDMKVELGLIASSSDLDDRILHALNVVMSIGALYLAKLQNDEEVDHDLLEHVTEVLVKTVNNKHRTFRETECRFVIPFLINKVFKDDMILPEEGSY